MFRPAKRPQTSDNHIGLEIEFMTANGRADLEAMRNALGNLAAYVQLDWENIDNESTYLDGFEAKLLVKESEYSQVVPAIFGVLSNFAPLVDNRCGLHVHLDMRNRDEYQAFKTLVESQDKLYAKIADHRKENVYCKRNIRTNLDEYNCWDKYWAINSLSLESYRTLEVRLHESTFDASKVIDWIGTILAIVNQETLAQAA